MPIEWPPDEEIDVLIEPELRAELGDPIPVALTATIVYLPLLVVGLVLAVFGADLIPGRIGTWQSLLPDIGIGAGVGLGVVGITWSVTRIYRPMQALTVEFRKILGPLTLQEILRLALLSGIAEEVLFRGWLQPVIGYFAASLIFGLLHFVPSRTFVPWTVFAVAAGFLFGGLLAWRGSVVAPIVAHCLVNGLNLCLITREAGRPLQASPA